MLRKSSLDPSKEQTAVYKFGLLNPLESLDQERMSIFFKQNNLWNKFVEIDHADRQAYEQIRRDQSPEYDQLSTEIELLDQQIKENIAAKKRVRQIERSRKPDLSGLNKIIGEARDRKRNCVEKRKLLKSALKNEIRPKVEALNKKTEAAIKAAEGQSELWWPHRSLIKDRYTTASQRAKKEGTMLNFHGFEGTGSYSFPFSQAKTYRNKSMRHLMDFGIQNVISIKPIPGLKIDHLSARSQQSRARHHLTLTIDRDKTTDEVKTMTWPIIFHRAIPADSIIQKITVSRKRNGDRFSWEAVFQVRDQKPVTPLSEHKSTLMCGIDPGWRLEENGELRVATLCTKVDNLFKFTALSLPVDLMKTIDRVDNTTSLLDREANIAWAHLYPLIKDANGEDRLSELKKRAVLNAKRSTEKEPEKNAPDRMMKAMYRYYRATPEAAAADPECFAILANWLEKTSKRQQENQNARRRCLRRRQHIYRNFAADLAKRFIYIHLESTPLAKLALNKKEPNGDGNALHKPARNQRTIAAISELFLAIENACRKSGSVIKWIDPKNTSDICSVCGTNNQDLVLENLIWTCKSCGTTHHRDENAARNIYNADPFENEAAA